MRRAALLVLGLVLLLSLQADALHNKNRKAFRKCGGAKACLGAAKLERVRRKHGMMHKTVDELAQQLDADEDLVGLMMMKRCTSPLLLVAAQQQYVSPC